MQSSSNNRLVYRLRGVVGGREKTFDLVLGSYRIGRTFASDLVLPDIEVSREHAALRVTPEGLEIEDLGSRNGCFVDGRRIDRATVAPGAEVRFGAVTLQVEAVDAGDVELGLALETSGVAVEPKPSAPGPDDIRATVTQRDVEQVISREWLSLLERFIERLTAGALPDLAGALVFLVEALGTRVGACAVDWTPAGDPVVLGAAGELPPLPSLDEIQRLRSDRERTGSDLCTAFLETEPVLSLAARFGRGQEPRCLLLWGDFPGRLRCATLLRALLRLVDLREPRLAKSPHASAGPGCFPELVFPDDYRPGTSPAAAAMYRHLGQSLSGHLAVLVVGETGVGKERVAKILHESSERRQGPIVAINCAAIPAEMLEAEMFGIGKGVATGVDPRPGTFQLAEGGTLFLDEVGDMAPALQAKLLRALQEREIQPVGKRPRRVDVRVIAATNADLQLRMEEGTFRRDLYYRLAGHLLEVPPLRHAREDIPALVEHFLRRFAGEAGRSIRGVTAKALRLLAAYPWPGNVRELEHEMHRLVCAAAEGQVIDSGMLAHRIRHPPRSEPEAEPEIGTGSLALVPRLRELESQLIREALRRSNGKQIEAAKLLGISRNGLANKLKRLGLRG
ncbi:MAG: FHA domain-containing protein [bacterium]|nr:FHA domain-containing protein [bacterium]